MERPVSRPEMQESAAAPLGVRLRGPTRATATPTAQPPFRRLLTLRLVTLLFGALLFGTLLSAAGCHSAPPMRAVDIDRSSPEKDVLLFEVEIDAPWAPRHYRDWAQEQLDLLGNEPRNDRYPGIPVYEVTYRYRIGRQTLAEVSFRREGEGQGLLLHARTVVRPVPGWLLDRESRRDD